VLQLIESGDDASDRSPSLTTAAGMVSVTASSWRLPSTTKEGAEVLRVDTTYASAAMRDGFLAALDRDDALAVLRIARNLTGCLNPLPSSTCLELGLPVGSTYGAAARSVIAR